MPKEPTYKSGKICYIQIPAVDVKQSADFYAAVFGWQVRQRSDGHLAFDDSVGEVSGTWVTGCKPMTEAGLLIYIWVDSVRETMQKVIENGGKIVQPIGGDPGEITARFTDLAGNLLGLYQSPE